MARLELIHARDPRRLLRAAADGFLPLNGKGARKGGSSLQPFPSPDYLLVLRQGGLRDDLLEMAAEMGVHGWFDPPLCLFQSLPDWLCDMERRPAPCGDYERLVAVARALVKARHAGAGVFQTVRRPDAFADAVDRLFGELGTEGVTAETLREALSRRPDRDEFERRRDDELVAAYTLYCELLADAGRRDGRAALVECAAAVMAEPDAMTQRLGGRREIRVFGLQDLRAGWAPLLRALVASPALDVVRIYTAVELDPPEGLAARRVVLDGSGAPPMEVRAGALAAPVAGPDGVSAGAADARLARDVATPADGAARGGSSQIDLFAQDPHSPPLPDPGPRSRAGPPAGSSAAEPRASAVAVQQVGSGPDLAFVSAPDARRELEEVARRVRALLDDGETAPRIGVIVRSARPHTDEILAALVRLGVPATARQRRALEEVPVVRAVLTLFAVAAEGWTRHGLVELAGQPYLGTRLDTTVINHVGFHTRVQGLAAWESGLETLRQEESEREARVAAGEDSDDDRRGWHPKAERVGRALEQVRELVAALGALDEQHSLTEWLAWLDGFLSEDPLHIEREIFRLPAGRERLARLDAAAWSGMRQILRQWREALERWGGGGERLDVAGFDGRLRAVLVGDVVSWTETRRGVQVMEALAASHRSFDHVFLVGMDAGTFPRMPPRSPVWDEEDRDALTSAGLPLEQRAEWESREQALFHVLVAGARRSLTLSWSRDETPGGEAVRSAFVDELLERVAPGAALLRDEDAADFVASGSAEGVAENVARFHVIPTVQVLTPGTPLTASPGAQETAAHGARIERVRAADALSPWNGEIQRQDLRDWLASRYADDYLWSPTQLEAYAKCPWAFFSARLLHLERPEDPDDDMDPLSRGTLVHAALQRFYDAAIQRNEGRPVMLRRIDEEWAFPLLEQSLADAVQVAGDDVWLGPPALRQARIAELQRMLRGFLEFEIEEHETMLGNTRKRPKTEFLRTGVAAHELAFQDVVLDSEGVRFRYRGHIDRVEVGIDERIDGADRFVAAVDYKTTKYSTPGAGQDSAWRDGVVLQVPLYAFALAQQRPGSTVCRVEYRAVASPGTVHPLQLVQLEGGVPEEEAEAAQRMKDALRHVGEHVRDVRAGVFPAQPAPSCGCPPYCHARDICRVPGGPRTTRDR